MIEKKCLNNKKIKDILFDNYDIKVKKIDIITGGSAEIYKINDKYILKLYQSKYTKDDILREIDVVNYLSKKELKIVKFIESKNGYIVPVSNRWMVLSLYIKGTSKDKFMANIDEIKECGYLHGLLVKYLRDYSTDIVLDEDWYDFDAAKKKLENIKELGNNEDIIYDMNLKIDMINNFKYDLSDINKISYYVSHGDFSYLQFIYGDDSVNAIIDFIRVKKLPICYEIIRSYSYMGTECKNGVIDVNNLIIYIKEFSKNAKLNLYDLKMMPYVYLCQLLRSTYGYKEYYKNNDLDILEFARFRTKMCKYLFDNVDKISEELVASFKEIKY